jgi:dihydrofolate reductase
MKKNLIVAMAKDNIIGVNNSLPWSIPEDLKRFKKLTLGYPIIMGRKTHESIGRVLSGRENIVITSEPEKITDLEVKAFKTIEDALTYCEEFQYSQVFFIGGAKLYEQVLDSVDMIYLTQIEAEIAGDTKFPKLDYSQFKILKVVEGIGSNHPHWFLDMERIKKS